MRSEFDVPAITVPVAQEPARLFVAPALAEELTRGLAVIPYRVENLRILPVYGRPALEVAPRVGHVHITIDDEPWHWVDASGEPLIVQGLCPGPHDVLIELADPTHHVIDRQVVSFEIPPKATRQSSPEARPPFPPFTRASAIAKVRLAEDGWNSRDPERVSRAYTQDSRWRNRNKFVVGRPAIVAFLADKWQRECDYRLIKELWAFSGDRIAVRFAYEWHDVDGSWFRSYGNENWEFDADGLMRVRHASINDLPIREVERLFRWDSSGPRPADHASLSELGL
jgi:nuclear transport factor 2 (NTF2) superfamily protein